MFTQQTFTVSHKVVNPGMSAKLDKLPTNSAQMGYGAVTPHKGNNYSASAQMSSGYKPGGHSISSK